MSASILIAEDSAPLAASLSALLRGKGYRVACVGDGNAAWQALEGELPQLLLLDLKLPGLHGIDLLRRLRQAPRSAALPVVVMSGVYKGERFVAGARALGVAAYLEKPFRAAELLAAVQGALAAEPSAAPHPPSAATVSDASEVLTLDRHLARAYLARFSGILRIPDTAGAHEVVLLHGLPVSLRPGFNHADFGQFLLRQGVFNENEYAFYARAGAFRHDLPVQLGCLSYAELLQQKLAYLSDELVAGFARPAQAAVAQPLPAPPGLQVPGINLPQLLYLGYRRLHSVERGRRLLEQAGPRYLALTPAYYQHINFLSLELVEREALARIDGRCSVRDCLAGEEQLVPLLQVLQVLGMVRFGSAPLESATAPPEWPLRTLFNAVPAEGESEVELLLPAEQLESFVDLVEEEAAETLFVPEAEPLAAPAGAAAGPDPLAQQVRQTFDKLQGKNYYEVFELTQGKFSFELLKERYFAITRQFGPDVLMQLGGAEAGMVEEILATVTGAYNTLSDVVKKESYDELLGSDKVGLGQKGDDHFQAQVQSQSGKVFIDMEEWDNAEKALQDACNIEPANGDYQAHLAWAIYRNPKYANSRAMQEKARQMLNRALTQDRTAAGHAFKGWMQLESGQDAFAEGEFNRALKLDARNLLARKGLRQLQEKKEQQKKGLFGLFR